MSPKEDGRTYVLGDSAKKIMEIVFCKFINFLNGFCNVTYDYSAENVPTRTLHKCHCLRYTWYYIPQFIYSGYVASFLLQVAMHIFNVM